MLPEANESTAMRRRGPGVGESTPENAENRRTEHSV